MDKYKFKKSGKMENIEDIKKVMITKKKPVKMVYHYLYSDSYKTIEKLLVANNKKSLILDDEELSEDI